MKRKVYGLLMPLLLLVSLSACRSDASDQYSSQEPAAQRTEDQRMIEALQSEIKKLTQELEQARARYESERESLAAQLEKERMRLDAINERLRELTILENVAFDVLADDVYGKRDESVVMASGFPEEKQEYVLLKAAVEFSDYSGKLVSIWKDREKAEAYITGNYDAEETHAGWTDLDARIGWIDNRSDKPVLYMQLGRDDYQPIDFGKYRIEHAAAHVGK